MTKKWIDWDKTEQLEPEDPRSKPVTPGKGEQVAAEQLAKIVRNFAGAHDPGPSMRQPTKEEIEDFLCKTLGVAKDEEELLKREEQWHNAFNDFFQEVRKPVEQQKLKKNKDLGRGPIEDEVMTEEEKRISAIPVNPALYEGE